MNRLVVTTLFLSISIFGNSQDIDTVFNRNKIKWTNSAQLGILFDANNELTGRLLTRFTSGMEMRKFTGSLGVGIDDYANLLVVPFFLEFQFELLKSEWSPLIFIDVGKGLVLDKKSFSDNSIKGGMFMAAGLGYKWNIRAMNLFLKTGYQLQMIHSEIPTIYYGDYFYLEDSFASVNSPRSELLRKMGRVSFSAGINF